MLTAEFVLQHYIANGNVEALTDEHPQVAHDIAELAWRFQDRVDYLKAHVRKQYNNVRASFGPRMTREEFEIAIKAQRNAEYLRRLLDDESITDLAQREVLENYERYGLEL